MTELEARLDAVVPDDLGHGGDRAVGVVRERETGLAGTGEALNGPPRIQRNSLALQDRDPLDAVAVDEVRDPLGTARSGVGDLEIVAVITELDIQHRGRVQRMRVADHDVGERVHQVVVDI